MRLGIDGSNLRAGGGVTHLVQLLAAADPDASGFEEVVVWASQDTIASLPNRPWLRRDLQTALNGRLPARVAWRHRSLPRLARGCDVLFVPGGGYRLRDTPSVLMSRNMLPFEPEEMSRYGWSWMRVRLRLLRHTHIANFRRAAGVIFLNEYARQTVTRWTGPLPGATTIIPHGVDAAFVTPPRPQRPIGTFSSSDPFKLLYVSIVDVYKHQAAVAEAVARLRAEGLPVTVDFVGPAYPPSLAALQSAIARLDPAGAGLHHRGPVSFANLPQVYRSADAFVFASSCENMPNILIEAMTSGLPIASSSRGPMPEVLGSAGIYFDPLDTSSIRTALRELVTDDGRRREIAGSAFERARQYSWRRCAAETFGFLRDVAAQSQR